MTLNGVTNMSMSISSSYDWLLEQQESRALAARNKTTAADETQQAQQVSAEQEVQTQTAESAQIKPSGGSADTVQISAQGRAYQGGFGESGRGAERRPGFGERQRND